MIAVEVDVGDEEEEKEERDYVILSHDRILNISRYYRILILS